MLGQAWPGTTPRNGTDHRLTGTARVALSGGAAILAMAAIARFGATPWGVFLVLVSWVLLTLGIIDARNQMLPDCLTLPLLWLGLMASIVPGTPGPTPAAAIGGPALGYGLLWSLGAGFQRLTGQAGIGGGDCKLAAALGAWLGFTELPHALTLGAWIGQALGCIGIFSGRMSRSTPMAFGPWIALGGWVTLIVGPIGGYL